MFDTKVGPGNVFPLANLSKKSCTSSAGKTFYDCGLIILVHILISSESVVVKCSMKHLSLQNMSNPIFAFSLDQSTPSPAKILKVMSSKRSPDILLNSSSVPRDTSFLLWASLILSLRMLVSTRIFVFTPSASRCFYSLSSLICSSWHSILTNDWNSASSWYTCLQVSLNLDA